MGVKQAFTDEYKHDALRMYLEDRPQFCDPHCIGDTESPLAKLELCNSDTRRIIGAEWMNKWRLEEAIEEAKKEVNAVKTKIRACGTSIESTADFGKYLMGVKQNLLQIKSQLL